ncbi:hypothetical protein [Gaoshiqia sediminis]|uniref:Uncharacterized protein n=1 Tax=Gaoshiqia sediminis TaxID=2986998 RepID=A0AA42C8Z8_9BACT|nr:hypothetical protein [Gaoshiqia sediminis]MCW0483316.1 hypothetical protein [Gaoshiqia sediminis]
MLVELKGIYLKRYWAGWLRWKKYFEIKLGAIVQSSEKEKEKSGV